MWRRLERVSERCFSAWFSIWSSSKVLVLGGVVVLLLCWRREEDAVAFVVEVEVVVCVLECVRGRG